MANSEDPIDEIRRNLKEDKVVIGTNEVIKELRKGKIAKIFLASNPSPKTEGDIESAADLEGCPVEKVTVPNDELGTLCKKQFSISAVGIRK
jgi:ribosomal protein L30E